MRKQIEKYKELLDLGKKVEACHLRTKLIKDIYFGLSRAERNEKYLTEHLANLIADEANDLIERYEGNYEEWVAYHKRDNNGDLEMSKINTFLLLQMANEKRIFLDHPIEDYYAVENATVYKNRMQILIEKFILKKLSGDDSWEEMKNLTLNLEMDNRLIAGLTQIVKSKGELEPFEKIADSMSDDVVFDSGLDEDQNHLRLNLTFTLALAYWYAGDMLGVKRLIGKVKKQINEEDRCYWTFRFLEKEICVEESIKN